MTVAGTAVGETEDMAHRLSDFASVDAQGCGKECWEMRKTFDLVFSARRIDWIRPAPHLHRFPHTLRDKSPVFSVFSLSHFVLLLTLMIVVVLLRSSSSVHLHLHPLRCVHALSLSYNHTQYILRFAAGIPRHPLRTSRIHTSHHPVSRLSVSPCSFVLLL